MDEQRGDPFGPMARPAPPGYPRRAPRGVVVAVLEFKRERRALQLIRPNTRAIRRGEIHELMVTDDAGAAPGGTVDRVAGVAFVEFTTGGILGEGDCVVIAGAEIGAVVGFDESHMPNHQNILLRAPALLSGVERGLALEARVEFVQRRSS